MLSVPKWHGDSLILKLESEAVVAPPARAVLCLVLHFYVPLEIDAPRCLLVWRHYKGHCHRAGIVFTQYRTRFVLWQLLGESKRLTKRVEEDLGLRDLAFPKMPHYPIVRRERAQFCALEHRHPGLQTMV